MSGWSLALAASAFWAGILLGGLSETGVGVGVAAFLLVIGLSGLGASLAAARADGGRALWGVLVVVSFGLLGAGWASLRDARVRSSPLALLAGRDVTAWGQMSSDPQQQALGWTASLRVDTLFPSSARWPGAVRLHDELWLEGHGSPPRVGAGDRVAVQGSLSRLHGDFGRYLGHRGYPATCFVDSISSRGPPTNPLMRAADGLRSALRNSLARVFPSRHAGLVMGLTLGDTSRLDSGIEEDFRAAGLSHLTAVSGENLAMFLAPVMGLGLLVGLGRRARFALGMGAIAFFVLLTRAEPSVLRAAAMSGLTLLGIFLGRPRSAPAIMGAAVLVLLELNPTLVYAIGFQLSVAATAGMAILAAPVSDRLRFLPAGLSLAAGTTIGAQAGVTPLLLYHFGVVPMVSVPANLMAFPAVGPGMLLGLAAAALGLLFRPAGVVVAGVAAIPLGYLEGLADRLARSPLPSVTSEQGHLVSLLAGIALVIAAGWWLRSGRKLPRRAVAAGFLVLPLFLWASALRAGPPAALTVTFFDVGQGDSALIRSPGGATILIDGGPDPEEVATKLAALGVRRIDLMVATHPHADHVAGLPAVLARFPVGLVVDPGCRGSSPFYAEFLRAVSAAGVGFQHPRPGAVLQVGDVRLDVLGPEHCFFGTDSDPNNDSLILRVRDGPATVMFPGDAEQDSQTDVLWDEPSLVPAAVLKVPHHGGDTSLPEFFVAVHAAVAVVSVGPNRYGHPVGSVLTALASDGMRIYRTDRSGDVTVTFDRRGLVVGQVHPVASSP